MTQFTESAGRRTVSSLREGRMHDSDFPEYYEVISIA